MSNYSLYHVRTSKAGSFYYSQPRERGVMRVWYDSSLYEYRIPFTKGNYRKIRAWIEDAFANNHGDCRVTGNYPNYDAEGV
jgi:hypothetical protein